MKKYLVIKILLINLFSLAEDSSAQSELSIFSRWDKTDKLIRDRKIDEDSAIDSLRMYVSNAVQHCKILDTEFTKRKDWVFPMSGWTKVSYRNNGRDYKDKDFDYFQGGEFKGHPAHDIFILDKDSNGVEDSTLRPVEAAAMVTGVIISVHTGWKRGDFLRSGNYVKLFDPESESIFYYSHLDSILVSVGQMVAAGETIGYIGRTGRKAIHGRTHLHIAYYKINDGYPEPEDIIMDLYRAEKRTSPQPSPKERE
ncbi:MAG: M23 family metallopeptidase [Ignavibacteria bacterium]